ncbi:MAG: hypothetical protein ABIS21_06350 [Acidimicrobiales bacterium]
MPDRLPTRRVLAGRVAVAAIIVGGLLLRLWILNSNLGPIDSDEAVGGLIARDFAHGRGAVFLWGNVYGGTFEAILAAPLLAITGASAVAWKSVMVVMYACACVLTWRIGLRTVGPSAARLGASLMWLAPAPLVLMSTKARLYYGTALVLTCALLLLSLRLVARRSRTDMALLGLVLGLGVWTAPFVFYVFVPVLVWLALRSPRRLWDVPLALPGFLAGSAPWLAFNLRNSWSSLDLGQQGIDTTYNERLRGFFADLLPRLTGLRTYGGAWQGNGAGKLVFLACLAAFGLLAVACLFRRAPGLTPLVVIVVAYPFLFALPEASWYVNEPRYGLFLAPTICLLGAAGVTRLVRGPPAHLAVVALAALASVAGLSQLMEFAREFPGSHDLSSQPVGALGDALEGRGITTVVADYWISYAVTFETDERVIATPIRNVRYRPYDERVRAAGATDYVMFPGSAEARDLEERATQQGIRLGRESVAGFDLYRLDAPLGP